MSQLTSCQFERIAAMTAEEDDASQPAASQPGFTPDYLATKTWDSAEEADTELRALASRVGFALCRNDSLSQYQIQFFCTCCGKNKGAKKTKKTDCPFFFWVNRNESRRKYVIGQRQCLDHNHDLSPATGVSISDRIEIDIQALRRIGVPPMQIAEFILKRHQIVVSPGQIARVSVETDPAICSQETDELDRVMAEEKGKCEFYDLPSEFEPVRIAAFTQTTEEAENLRKFGQVIFFDGTDMTTTLRWDLFPIILIDHNKQLCCGGAFHLGLQTYEVFRWVLNIIAREAGESWRVLFTDEDSSLMVAVPDCVSELPWDVTHYICVFHKRANIVKHIKSAHLGLAIERHLLELTYVICFGKVPEAVAAALDSFCEIAPELYSYIQETIRPRVPQFADCEKGRVFTAGYKATAPSESANSLFKRRLGGRTLTLTELRRGISHVFQ
jgi:hypothetical protein